MSATTYISHIHIYIYIINGDGLLLGNISQAILDYHKGPYESCRCIVSLPCSEAVCRLVHAGFGRLVGTSCWHLLIKTQTNRRIENQEESRGKHSRKPNKNWAYVVVCKAIASKNLNNSYTTFGRVYYRLYGL